MSRSTLRLAYVVHSLDPGGTERLAVDMARHFARTFDTTVFCLDSPGHWAGSLREAGVAVHCLWRQPGLDIGVAWRLARAMRAHRIDVVHAHQCTPWFYAALARLVWPAPRLLFEEHGRFHPEQVRRRRILFNRLVTGPLTHRIVAVSRDVKARLERYEGLPAGRIDVVYNGVRPERRIPPNVRREKRRALGFDDSAFVVGTVGRFDPIKNLPMLIEAIGVARDSVPRVRGLLVGDGPEAARVRRLAAAGDLLPDIVFTGFRDDARTLVQCMDLFVLSSLSEGTSIALLEAISAGVPVAVTAVGGNPEVVIDGATGWVVPSMDASALAAVVVEAASDPVRCVRYAAAGRRRFQACFSRERMMEAYGRAYSTLVETTG